MLCMKSEFMKTRKVKVIRSPRNQSLFQNPCFMILPALLLFFVLGRCRACPQKPVLHPGSYIVGNCIVEKRSLSPRINLFLSSMSLKETRFHLSIEYYLMLVPPAEIEAALINSHKVLRTFKPALWGVAQKPASVLLLFTMQ